MKTEIIILALKRFESRDGKSLLIMLRITVTCKYHAYSGFIGKLKVYIRQPSVDAGVHHIYYIIFHPAKYNLCLRISESCVILKNLRTILCQHQTEENHSAKRSSLRGHGVDRRHKYILLAKIIHFLCIEGRRGKITHSACIKTFVIVLGTLMILGA